MYFFLAMNGKSRTFAIPITKKRGERQYKDWEVL